MPRPKKENYDERVEVRITTAKKALWLTLLRDEDDSLSAFLRRAGDAYEKSILASRTQTTAESLPASPAPLAMLPPLPPSPPTSRKPKPRKRRR